MGGGQSSQQANTSNTSNANTHVGGSIGLTGAQAQNVINTFTRTFAGSYESAIASNADLVRSGFQLSQHTTESNASLLRDFNSQFTTSLANLTNVARDVSQRTIAAGIGQATPLQNIPAADDGSQSKMMLYLTIAGVLIAFMALKK